jgi:acetylornithine/LysW-gamma-L-lysine aminotransferase
MERLRLIKSSKIREVRGLGLMIGIELKEKAKPYVLDLLERGLLVLPSGLNIIRLLPPLTIPRDDIDRVIERIAASIGDKEKSFPLD